MRSTLNLPQRSGESPETTDRLPHSQLTQHGPDHVIDQLHKWCFSLPNVTDAKSGVSVPGSHALVIRDGVECNDAAFMVGREFAHIHPSPDNGSMHVQLPREAALEVIEKGWGESHYLVTQGFRPLGLVLVFSPRDDEELEAIKSIVGKSYEYAIGATSPTQKEN